MWSGEFDGIIIGSGHNGLALGGYMARQGLRVLVLERRMDYGGATITQEVTLPGFYHNLHANFIWSGSPVYTDFDLKRYGCKHVYGEVERAFLFDDGEALITYTDDPHRSYKQFQQIVGQNDLDALEYIFEHFSDALVAEYYSVPKPDEERGEALADDKRREYQTLCAMSGREVVNHFFESDKLKSFLVANACVRGITDFYPGTGDYFLRMAIAPKIGIIEGGTSQIAHATAAYFHAHGGLIRNGAHVERVIVESGRATGVELSNGERFKAEKFVASEVDPPATFLRMVGREHLPDIIVERCNNWEIERHNALYGFHAAVSEAPVYRTSQYAEEANVALQIFFGLNSLAELDQSWKEISAGKLPTKPWGDACCHSVIDPRYAPPGKHTLLFWQMSPAAGHLSDGKSYDDVKWDYFEAIRERWESYAPNMSTDVYLGKYCYTPADIEKRLINMVGGGCRQGSYGNGQYYNGRPFPECSDYRTPIDGLYLCGSSCHPGGSLNFGPGYNCANAIVEDMRVERWWPEYHGRQTPIVSSREMR